MRSISLLLSIPVSFVSGLLAVLSSGRLMALFAVQILLGIATYGALAWAAVHYHTELTALLTGQVDTWWERLLSYVLTLVTLLMGGVVTYIIMTIFGGFLMEWLVQTILQRNGIPVDESLSIAAFRRTAG
jgi:hypothetical protein